MADRADSNGFEGFQDLNRAFWEQWLESGAEAFREGAETASKAWGDAAGAWQAWLPREGQMPGPDHVMDTLASQGRAFLELGESVSKADDLSEALDRWLDAISGANTATFHAFAMPAEAFKGMMPPGGAMDPAQLLSMPTLGYSREHQAAQQKLVRSQLEFQKANARYNAQVEKALRDAAGRFRERLAEAVEPGEQINSLRELYDLWVDTAEEAFAEVAFSLEFRQVYGELVNALMRSRQAYLEVTEPVMKMAGVPTRGEVDDTARQLHDLRREVADLKARMQSAASAKSGEARKPAAAGKVRSGRASVKKSAGKKATAKKAAKKKAAGKSSNARGQKK
jgi:hypothetical protein